MKEIPSRGETLKDNHDTRGIEGLPRVSGQREKLVSAGRPKDTTKAAFFGASTNLNSGFAGIGADWISIRSRHLGQAGLWSHEAEGVNSLRKENDPSSIIGAKTTFLAVVHTHLDIKGRSKISVPQNGRHVYNNIVILMRAASDDSDVTSLVSTTNYGSF